MAESPLRPDLGALADLPGVWRGTALSIVTLPSSTPQPPFVVSLERSKETLQVERIPDTPNRSNVTLITTTGRAANPDLDIAIGGLSYRKTCEIASLGVAGKSRKDEETGLLLGIPKAISASETTADRPDEFAVSPYLVRHALIPDGYALSQWGRDSRTDKKPDIPNLAWTANGIAITDGSLAAYRHDLAVPVGKQIDDLVDSVDGFLTNPNHYLQHAVGKSGHDLSSTVTVDLALRAAAQAATFAANVQVRSARISYWIETVHGGPDRMVVARQLLYSQTVTLSIDGKDYDQVTVGVLLKDAESAPPASQASQASRRR